MNLNTQIAQLYAQLNAELDHVPAGEKFFPVQEIIRKFHTNRRVVDGTLKKLEKEGLIARIPRVGIFSCAKRCEKKYRILFLRVDWPSPFNAYYAQKVIGKLTSSGRYILQEECYRYDSPIFYRRNLEGYDAVIFLRDAAYLAMEDLQVISRLKIPVVQLDSNGAGLAISSLGSDHYQGGMAAAECLLRHGHRRILILNAQPAGENSNSRISGFRARAELAGASVIELDAGTAHGEEPNSRCYRALTEYVQQKGVDFSAVFITAAVNAEAVYAALQDLHLRVPEDISVIGFGGVESGVFLRPALTTVINDFDALMQALLEGMNGLLLQGKIFHTLIPLSILERDSVRNFENSRIRPREGK